MVIIKRPPNMKRWKGKPFIHASPASQPYLNVRNLRIALQHHHDLDNLPYSFCGRRGVKVMIATTTDFAQTYLFLPVEWENYAQQDKLRLLNSETIDEM